MELTLDQALQKGVEAHKAGKAQEADQYYTTILKANPKHPDANHNMGILAVGVGKVEQALPFFKTALEVNPKIEQFWLSYIDALIKLDRMAEAKAVFDQAKNIGMKGGDFDKLAKRVNEPTQDQLQPLIDLYTQGQLDQALRQASKLLLKFPISVTLRNICGVANQGKGRLNKALEAYNAALSIQPDYAEAYGNMGVVLKEQGKLEEAVEAYSKAISLKPDYAEAYNNIGNALKDQGKFEEAIEAYSKAISLKPDYADAYYNMGSAFREQEELEEATEAFNKVISLNPAHGSAKHMVSSLSGITPKTAPREYVEKLFDGYAKRFEVSLVDTLDYKIPKLITDILIQTNTTGSLGSVLDLGCGTGLLGQNIKGHCSKLEGIDLSNKMLEVASQKKVYDKLSQSDIIEYLSSIPLDFDYYVALDVFIYIGELTEIFRLIRYGSKKPGKLVFSTEHSENDGYHILNTGRFSHSHSYILNLCKQFDYKMSHFSTNKLRKEKGSFLIGGIYVLEFT